MWVQLASCQLIGLLFAAWTPEEIIQPHSGSTRRDFIQMDSIRKVLIYFLLYRRVNLLTIFSCDLGDNKAKNYFVNII